MMKRSALKMSKLIIDIPEAAESKNYSLRHFRRILQEMQVRILEFGNGKRKKFFVLRADIDRIPCRQNTQK